MHPQNFRSAKISMSKLFFVDTNILFYAYDTTEISKHKSARRWLEFLWEKRVGTLSAQVLAEFSNLALNKIKPGMQQSNVQSILKTYEAWQPVQTNTALLRVALEIQGKFKFSWWDSLILAGAGASQSTYFLTEDLQDRQKIGSITVVNPMKVIPEAIHTSGD